MNNTSENNHNYVLTFEKRNIILLNFVWKNPDNLKIFIDHFLVPKRV